MTLGEKIRELRIRSGLTQEGLAEKLHVSRSAIAKWEAGGGLPDLSNLKLLAELFSVSIDSLLDHDIAKGQETAEPVEAALPCFVGKVCDIELTGWNNGAYDVLILGEDEQFYYYRCLREARYGCIGKRYVRSVTPSKKTADFAADGMSIDRSYFLNRPVCLEVAHKEGLLGFFDFRNDDYRNVVIREFSAEKVVLVYGGEVDVGVVCKVEEC